MYIYKRNGRIKLYIGWFLCFACIACLVMVCGKQVKAENDDEPLPEPTPTEVIVPTEAPTPTNTPEPTPTEVIGETPVPTPTPEGGDPTPTPEQSNSPTPKVTGTPTATISPTSTPYVTIIPPDKEGHYNVKETNKKANASGIPKLVIDGEVEDIWNRFADIPLENIAWGEKGASASFRMTWDSQQLYLLITVHDSTPNRDSEFFTRKDGIEIFINENGNKPEAYGAGDQHYRISATGELLVGNGGDADTLQYAVKDTENGYMIETSIPFQTIQPVGGEVIGFDLRVNDSQGKDSRDYVLQWSDTSIMTHVNLSHIGTVTLR